MGILKHDRAICSLFVLFSILFLTIGNAAAQDTKTLDNLEKIIQQQQRQIEAQAKALEQLQKQVSAMQSEQQKIVESGATKKGINIVTSGNKNAEVTLYGQVNRGVLLVDDGDDTTTYQVDNDNSSTRIGIAGKITPSEDMEIGTKIEVQFESNSSSAVDQNHKRDVGDNNFTKRHLDLYFDSKPYGKLSMGYGSAASDSTAETDLSGTTLVGYSSISDMAGGQLFYDNDADDYSDTTIGNVVTNMDGLGRDDRIRYDTPSFYDVSAAASYIADGGGDIALRYGKKFNSFQLAAAASYSNPGSTSSKTDYQISSSVSALHNSGISMTLAGGQREHKSDADSDDSQFFYTKLGYQADIFSFGKSAFSVDYGIFNDIDMDGDEASSFGAQYVQIIKDWGTEYYLGYRFHKLDRDNADFEDINAVLSGFRIKF